MDILPSVLAHDEADFRNRLLHPHLTQVAGTFHIDILDGTLFAPPCWANPTVVGKWQHLPDIEIHCMVRDPLPVALAWKKAVPTLQRAIVHQELGRKLGSVLQGLQAAGILSAIAVNPTTPIDDVRTYASDTDGLMIMGVTPGASGQPFLGEPILAKLRRARALFPQLPLSLDGGVNEHTMGALKSLRLDSCVVGSALWKSEKPQEAYEHLHNLMR